jgi:hypothetical protein
MILPASNATLSTLKGERPAAILSALTNSLHFKISGKMVKLAVVLPAPLHPAIMYNLGINYFPFYLSRNYNERVEVSKKLNCVVNNLLLRHQKYIYQQLIILSPAEPAGYSIGTFTNVVMAGLAFVIVVFIIVKTIILYF